MTDSTKRAACCQRGVGQRSIQILAKGDTSAARDVEIKSIPLAYFLSSDGSLARRMALGLQRNENTVKRFLSRSFPPEERNRGIASIFYESE